MYTHVYMCMCVYVYMIVYVCVCVYVYVHTIENFIKYKPESLLLNQVKAQYVAFHISDASISPSVPGAPGAPGAPPSWEWSSRQNAGDPRAAHLWASLHEPLRRCHCPGASRSHRPGEPSAMRFMVAWCWKMNPNIRKP